MQKLVVAEFNAGMKVDLKVAHQLGKVLRETVDHAGVSGKAGPGRGKTTDNMSVVSGIPECLAKTPAARQKISSRLQALAKIPWPSLEERIDQATEKVPATANGGDGSSGA